MIEQQIRTWEVLDETVLALYNDIWRENFIASPQQRPLAYADMALPIAYGEHMLEPKLEARMLQILAPKKTECILHIGCGSGFFAALLGRLAQSVVSVEIHPELAQQAATRLRAVENTAVTVVNTDGLNDVIPQAPFDAVVLTGSLPSLPQKLLGQIKPGGRLLAVIGTAPAMCLSSFEKRDSSIIRNNWLETHIPALHNAPATSGFEF